MSEERTIKAALDSYKRDKRFYMLAQSCVAEALHRHGQIDLNHAAQAAYDIALEAVTVLLQQVYENDAELNRLRTERDHFQKLALRGLELSPPTVIMIDQALSDTETGR